jgi:uncharacterized protein YndB with AHSA1/START domain
MKINVETTVAAPIEQVWRAYTTPAEIKQWNAASDDWHTTAASVDLREGGAFSSRMEAKDGSMGFDFAGTYTKIVEHKLIEYSFGDRMAQVEFTLTPKASSSASPLTANRRTPSSSSKEGGRQFSTISPAMLKPIKRNRECVSEGGQCYLHCFNPCQNWPRLPTSRSLDAPPN